MQSDLRAGVTWVGMLLPSCPSANRGARGHELGKHILHHNVYLNLLVS
uniref:DJ-1 family protein n=1 Tax=Arundo donax TaxID=35708 RepID=A0A0A9H0F7_ARUDO